MSATHQHRGVLLKNYSYYQTGGTCDVLHAPTSIAELVAAVKEIKAQNRPWFLLGGGTNSLVVDDHFPGAVLIFRGLNQLDVKGTKVIAGAGVENSVIARLALNEGLAGAGWMYRLPGQLGGTVRMNARCYGGEISQIVSRVECVSKDGEVRVYDPRREGKIFLGYKDTLFMKNGDLIAGVELALSKGDPATIEKKMLFCESDREGKGQFAFPSCGCVFKNDYKVGVSSGILLDAAGAKSLRRNGAEVSAFHANFVYNKGASSRGILELTMEMRELVYRKFGVWLEYEMEILGLLPEDLRKQVELRKAARLNEQALAPLRERMQAQLAAAAK